MYTLGSGFIPSSIHAGGLRYHGMSPIVSKLYHDGYIDEAKALFQNHIFDAATLFAKKQSLYYQHLSLLTLLLLLLMKQKM